MDLRSGQDSQYTRRKRNCSYSSDGNCIDSWIVESFIVSCCGFGGLIWEDMLRLWHVHIIYWFGNRGWYFVFNCQLKHTLLSKQIDIDIHRSTASSGSHMHCLVLHNSTHGFVSHIRPSLRAYFQHDESLNEKDNKAKQKPNQTKQCTL